MIEALHFRQTIIDHPEDDGPRLVFADYLEDRGECARAELIRVECELARIQECRGSRIRKASGGLWYCRRPYCLTCRPYKGPLNRIQRRDELMACDSKLMSKNAVEFLEMELPALKPAPVYSKTILLAENGISDLHGMKFEFKRGMIEEVTMTPQQWEQNGDEMAKWHPIKMVNVAYLGHRYIATNGRQFLYLNSLATRYKGIRFGHGSLTALVPRTSAESNQPTSGQSAPAAPPRADEPVPASLSAAH